jgi:hypothetical protein
MTEEILVGIIIALVSGIVGRYIGATGKVSESACSQIRGACQNLLVEKMDNMSDRLDALTKIIDTKVLGI